MRVPFPERVSLPGAAVFAAVLFIIQQLEGTALYFSAGSVAFILLSALAFNIGGGLTRAAGAYVFFYSVLVVIIGLCYKAFLGEPAESNLLVPRTDMLVYVGGISGMLIAAYLSRLLRRKSALIKNLPRENVMYRASIGCMVFGIVGGFFIALLGESALPVITAFTQLNYLVPLGIILGVVHEIRVSEGRRSVNVPLLLAGGYFFWFYGLVNFSKQGMFTPLICWALPVCALRYRLSRLQAMSVCAGTFIIFIFLFPYAQYGRRFLADLDISGRIKLSTRLLANPYEVRHDFNEGEVNKQGYFNTPQGLWDRLTFIYTDDQLNHITDQGRVFGLYPIAFSFLNVIPHVFWPGKPAIVFGNIYAHEIGGIVSEENTTTGISFSPTADAYHMRRWVGVLVVAPLLWLMFFVIYDQVVGDLRTTPLGMLVIVLIAHTAPEGALTGPVLLSTFGLEIILFCAFFAAWIAPYVSIAVLGQPRPSAPLGINGYRPTSSLRS